jgi:isopentenyl-diphosphate Delta-isomerase
LTRANRKQEHIQYALSTGQERKAGFDDVAFVHQSLPNSIVEDVSLQSKIGELYWSSPIFINAMTGGGGEQTALLNERLSIIARETGAAMAVGSQMSAIKNPSERGTYEIVRKKNPKGTLLANLGSEATVQQANQAVEMIEADALQIHLNVIQELVMPEGDRDFRNAIDRIGLIADSLNVPVIVKETGFGINKEAAAEIAKTSVAAIDVGGFGGTNFSKIENQRRRRILHYFDNWGIPTAVSIVETTSSARPKSVLASGGIQNSLDMVKALGLGASAVGIAGYILKVLNETGLDKAIEEINELQNDLKFLLCALGCTSVSELQDKPMILSGEVYHWLKVRGLEPDRFSQR